MSCGSGQNGKATRRHGRGGAGCISGSLATVLEQRGLINNSLLFRLYARATGYDRRLQAGVYDVAENLSVHALLQLFASGKVQQHFVRIQRAPLVQLLPKLRSEEVLESLLKTLPDSLIG